MSYECKLNDGQLLELENEGEQTFVRLSSGDSGKNQSQGHGFRTGKWTNDPVVRHSGKSYYIQLQTAEGIYLLGIQRNEIRLLDDGPDLDSAEKVELTTSSGSAGMKPMEPMTPMAPMKPMRPMR